MPFLYQIQEMLESMLISLTGCLYFSRLDLIFFFPKYKYISVSFPIS